MRTALSTLMVVTAVATVAPAAGGFSAGIVGAEGGHSGGDNHPTVFMRQGDELQLYGYLWNAEDGDCIAALPRLTRADAPVECTAPSAELRSRARWYLATAVAGDYDNSAVCVAADAEPGCHDPIVYRRSEIEILRGRFDADVSDVAELRSLGDHRIDFGLAPEIDAILPGVDATPEVIAADEVALLFELVVRRDDSYTGVLTELLGVPFVYWPRDLDGRGHQTDRRAGADCVALVIYGQRRLGHPVPYVAPPALYDLMEVAARSRSGEPVPVRQGDVLHFGFQTAVVSQDLDPVGVLDPSDRIIHTYHGVAEEVALSEVPYGSAPFDVLRWPGQTDMPERR